MRVYFKASLFLYDCIFVSMCVYVCICVYPFIYLYMYCYIVIYLWCNGYRRRGMDTATRVQILNKTDCISHSTNTLGKGMNPIILPPAMGK